MSMVALRRFALFAALLVGCSGSGDGMTMDPVPPVGSGATLQFMLKAGGDVGPLPVEVGDLTVDSVAFWIDRLDLMGDRGDGDGQQLSGKLLDFTAGPPVPFHLDMADPALYSRLRVEIGDSEGNPAAFQGMSLSYRVTGKTAAGAPFVLSGRDGFQLDLRVVDGAELGAHTKLLCVVRLDMSGWWDGVVLAASAGPGGLGPGGSGSSDGDGHHSEGGDRNNNFVENVQRSASMTLSAVPR
jgi:hypothetical protein